jgi:ATP-dependent RNA helicase DDX31/DBP7
MLFIQHFLTPMNNILRSLKGMKAQVLPPLDVLVNNDKLRDCMINEAIQVDFENLLLLEITHSFIFRNMDKAQMIAGLIETQRTERPLLFLYAIVDMFVGLTACHFARSTANTSESVDTTQISQALKTCEQLKWMTGHSKWNFENKYLLLLAECQYTQGEMEKAAATYEASIKSAKEHKLIHEQAVACELAGYFYKDRGDDTTAMNMFKQARKAYIEWGAIGKASLLRQNTGIEDVSSP